MTPNGCLVQLKAAQVESSYWPKMIIFAVVTCPACAHLSMSVSAVAYRADSPPIRPGVLMSRPKQVGRHGGDGWAFTATATAAALLQADMMAHCLSTLKALLAYWKTSVPPSGRIPGGEGSGLNCVMNVDYL